MRWTGCLFLVVTGFSACNGRSTSEETSEGTRGGAPSRGGRANAGSLSTGGAATTGGVAGTGPAGTGGASSGRGGTSAGQGGAGGTGGGPDDDCSCDEPFEDFSCTIPVEEFCYGPRTFGCPPTLEQVRSNLEAVCNLDGEVGRYSVCGSTVVVTWIEGGENDYELVFDTATGALVGGSAYGYVGGGKGCYGSVRAGVGAPSCAPACRFCSEFDEGLGGEGGGPGLPLCEFPP